MTKILELKKNDLQQHYPVQITESDGSPVDLNGATIYCTMKLAGGAIKINRQTAGINVVDAVNGKFNYQWQSGDTDTVGKYYIEFEINPSQGGKFTVPADNSAVVLIRESLDAQ